jgi:hypothetical protein
MKKMVLGLYLALATLGFLMSPATAAASPPQAAPALSAADQAFLATLATAPAPVPAAKRPILGKALCTATANCGPGGTISCSGNNSTTSCSATDQNCPHQRGSVTCDGTVTQCPNACICELDCTADRADCVGGCNPCPAVFSCNITTCTETCHCKLSACF